MGKRKKYIEYNYEDLFDQELPKWDEYFIEYLLKTRKLKKVYAVKEIQTDQQLHIEIYPEYTRKEKEGLSREIRKKKGETQRNLNDRNSQKRFIRTAEHNFREGDYWITLTYGTVPEGPEKALANIQSFMKKINRMRKKAGLENAKYMYITEFVTEDGEPVRAHHHLLIDGLMDIRQVEAAWKHGRRNEIRPLEKDENGITGASVYMTKIKRDKGLKKYQRKWNSSQNLVKPPEKKHHQIKQKTIKEIIKNQDYVKEYLETSKRYEGYQYAQSTVRYNEVNGQYYITARMRKKIKEGGIRDGDG